MKKKSLLPFTIAYFARLKEQEALEEKALKEQEEKLEENKVDNLEEAKQADKKEDETN